MPDAPPAPDAERALDRKLQRILAGEYTPDDFVVADAKDADMAFGLMAGGPVARDPAAGSRPGVHRTRPAYLDAMRAEVAAGAVDVLLTSASNGERPRRRGRPGRRGDARRARQRHHRHLVLPRLGLPVPALAAVPHRPPAALCGGSATSSCTRSRSTTTSTTTSPPSTAYREFRLEAADLGLRHFLEVFNPNAPVGLTADDLPAFVNDSIVRLLAGVTAAHRPVFLKMAYNGRDAVAELVEHDPSVVVGILGGSAGTTRDTLELLHRAERAGARVALFGRKIQRAESQLDLLSAMRRVLGGELSPEDGVRAYHDALSDVGLESHRPLETDLQVTERALREE